MRSLSNRGIERDRPARSPNTGVAPVTLHDRIHGIEDGDVNNGHSTTGTAGAKLFPKYPSFAARHWRVIEAAGVDGDLIPAMDGVESLLWRARFCDVDGTEALAERLFEIAGTSVCKGREAKRQSEDQRRGDFHAARSSTSNGRQG